MGRPSFNAAWAAFTHINLPVTAVSDKLGGFVKQNIDSGIFKNACAIRMSYVLNTTGYPIVKQSGLKFVSGADKRQYMYRVTDMLRYLTQQFGTADKVINAPGTKDLSGMKGILLVEGQGWGDATGHVTLWNGSICADDCYLRRSGSFTPGTAYLWVLQ